MDLYRKIYNKLLKWKNESQEKSALLIEGARRIGKSNSSKTNLRIFPVEVKSSKNYTASSLDEFKKRFRKRIEQSFIIHPKQLSNEKQKVKIPPYFVPFVFIN